MRMNLTAKRLGMRRWRASYTEPMEPSAISRSRRYVSTNTPPTRSTADIVDARGDERQVGVRLGPMRRRSSALDTAVGATLTLTRPAVVWIAAIVCSGCFPTGSSTSSDGGTTVGFSAPTLELTISGVHFGPMAPDPGAFVDLVTTRDAGGKPMMS